MPKKLYLLRHGRVDSRGRYFGSTDLPLLPEGQDDLAAAGVILQRQNIEAILCSPLLRTSPGGKSIGAFLARINEIRQMIADEPAEKLLVISHGGVIRQLICSFLGLGPDRHLAFEIQPGLCSVVDLHSQGGVLTGLNQGN